MKNRFLVIMTFINFLMCGLFNIYTVSKATSDDTKKLNGIYEIYTGVSDTKTIDIQYGSKNDMANVQIYERDDVPQQKFKFVSNNDGTYTIIATHSNKALDVKDGAKEAGTNVWQYNRNNTDAQKWILKSCGNGYYNIVSKLNGLYLDINQGLANNEQNVQVYMGNGTNAQKFKLLEVKERKANRTLNDGIYNIYSKVTNNRILEVPNNNINSETVLEASNPNNKANQKFKFSYNSDGTYTITALHSSKVLDVKDASKRNLTKVQQYTSNGTDAQKWVIIKNNDNTYSIMSKSNGLFLDIESGSSKAGANIQTYHFNGTNAQKFTFELCNEEKGTKSTDDGLYRIYNLTNTNKLVENDKFEIKYVSNGYYKIKSKSTGKVLTVENNDPKAGSKILKQDDKDLDTQKWILKKSAESVFCIISKCGGMYLEYNNSSIQLKYENDFDNQRFIFINETPTENIKQVTDGIYQITTTSNKVLDISGGAYGDSANVQIWNNDKVQQQKFRISKVKDTNYYQITAINSAKAVDVQDGNTKLGTNIQQYMPNGTSNQYWYLRDCGNGYYNIVSKANGLVLDVADGKINNNGANIQLYYRNGTNAQKFKLVPINIIENNMYEIESKIDENKVLDISYGSTQDGANVQIWNADNVNQQRFKIEALSTDTYKIISKNSNKALTVDISSRNVFQSSYTENDNQKWIIKECGNGYYNIISKANGLVIDIVNAENKNGQNVQTYKLNNSDAQKFKFVTGFRKFYEEGSYGKSGLAVKGDWRGTDLKYYKIGKGNEVLFTTFSIHGFEDSYNNDGAELTYIANEFRNYLQNNIPEDIVNNWTIYIFPNLNPDGQKYGWTNNGPGRTTLYSDAPQNKGIDMNRNWSTSGESYITYKDNRNYNGTSGFQAFEARYLRDFLLKHQGNKNILIDTHGWLNETIGDYELGKYYRNKYGISNGNHIYSYGRGYLNNWARMSLNNARSVLVELPEVSNHNQTVNRNYAQKFINATMQLLKEI